MLKPDGFLPFFYSFDEKKAWKFSWSAAAVTLMGVLFLTLGCLATMSGFLNIGQALVAEGVNDLLHGAIALWKGDKITLKDYLTSKLISIAISAVTFGIGKLGSAAKSAWKNGFKTTMSKMTSSAKSSVKSLLTGTKSMLSMTFNKTALSEGWKEFGFELIKSTVTSFATNVASRTIDFGVDKIFDYIYSMIESSVKKEVQKKLEQMKPLLERLESTKANHLDEPCSTAIQGFFLKFGHESQMRSLLFKFLDKFSSEMSAKIRKPLTR